MKTEYGAWRTHTRVHAVGYDGKWLCGRSDKTASECSEYIGDVSCELCLKKLPEYAIKYVVPSSLVDRLEEALKSAKGMAEKARGKDSRCSIKNLDVNSAIYLESWIIPEIEGVLQHFKVIK